MLVVGLTGGIASGKSTVSRLLQKHGVPVVDADVLARDVVQPGKPAYQKIIKTFGTSILQPDGEIDRKKLGEIIFGDAAKRQQLNAIVHPAVRWAMLAAVIKTWLRGYPFCILDVPLLVEAGLWRFVGCVVVVFCSQDLQLQRIVERDGLTQTAAQNRIAAQMPLSDKVDYADHVVDNSGGLPELEQQVVALTAALRKKAGWSWRLNWLVPPLGIVFAVFSLCSRFMVRAAHRKR